MKLIHKIFFILFILGSLNATSQENYSGSFVLTDSISGFAEYEYEGSEDDPIFTGNFNFEYAKKLDTLVKSLIYEGKFENNKKEGSWIFSRKNLISGDTIKVDGYRISYPADGFEHKVESEFKDGMAQGKWLVLEQNFRNASPTDTLFSSEVSFNESFMQDELKARSKDQFLKAFFDEKGQADGRWVIEHLIDGNQIDEIRDYENGVFIAHFFKIGDKEYEIKHLGLDTTVDQEEDNWVYIDIKDAYFDIFELSNFGFASDIDISELSNIQQITKKTNHFLKKSITSFAYYDDFEIWSNITKKQKIEFGKFKVRKFDYTEDEKEKLTEIEEYKDQIKEHIHAFFNNSQVEIGRLNFESLNKYHRIFKLYKEREEELEDVAVKITNPALVYLERKKFIKSFAPNFRFPNQITYQYNEEEYVEEHAFPKVPNTSDFNIQTAHQFFKSTTEDLGQLSGEVENLLNDLKKQEELNELEEELLSKRNEIQFLFSSDNDNEDYNQYHEYLNKEAQELAESEFKKYVNISLDDKKDQISTYVECFDEILKFYDFLSDYPRKINRLDEEYTRVTFNPFMMVDMEERVKERLYQAYENYALPYLLEALKNNFTCDEIEAKAKNLETLYSRMINLREQDTQGIERRLRRVKDAETVLSILEIDIK